MMKWLTEILGKRWCIASLLFMLAYAVGIVRYKLMLVDQIVSRGMLFYVASYGATCAFAVLIAVSSLLLCFALLPGALWQRGMFRRLNGS